MADRNPSLLPPLWQRIVIGRNPLVTLARACVLAAITILIFGHVLRRVQVQGDSMLPTYRDGSRNVVNCWAFLFHGPRRGDVVCILTTGIHNMYLKRVVGLPGERIEIRRGLVFINGQPLSEPYVKERSNWNLAEKALAPDQYMLIGDNRGMDQRQHSWGEVSRDKILGKVLW